MKTILNVFILLNILFVANSCQKELDNTNAHTDNVYIAGWYNETALINISHY